MPAPRARPSLDHAAIGLSGLCLAHCVLTAVFVGTATGLGTLLVAPEVHRYGLLAAALLAVVSLGAGVWRTGWGRPAIFGIAGIAAMALALVGPHGWVETLLTVVGVSLVAYAHLLNRRTA